MTKTITKLKVMSVLVLAGLLSSGVAFAQVNINTASTSELESIRGLGSSKAKAIVTERDKNGPFSSPDDVSRRVKGIGDKTVDKLQSEGLMIQDVKSPRPASVASKSTGQDAIEVPSKGQQEHVRQSQSEQAGSLERKASARAEPNRKM